MPQISPMKWMMLSIITQSSMIQMTCFLNMKKFFTNNNNIPISLYNNKISWKW